ncbi:MAG TPA: IclR family transcriptional regulator [Trebonia sp.]|jgi:DNA-binding IclR family transcriptional regulator
MTEMSEKAPEQARRGRASESGNALSKALRVLEELATRPGPGQLRDLAAAAAVPKSTTYRILSILMDLNYVIQDESRNYAAGPRLRALGSRVADAPDDVDDVLAQLGLETGQTVHLGLRLGNRAVYTHKFESSQPYHMASKIGMTLDLHCTSIGKAILAYLPADEVAQVTATTGLPRHTEGTITDPRRLTAELAAIRQRGYAFDIEENERTVACLGVPVLDGKGAPLGAISVSTITFVVSRAELEGFAPRAIDAARRIAALLGGDQR